MKLELCQVRVWFYAVTVCHWQDYLKSLSFKEAPLLNQVGVIRRGLLLLYKGLNKRCPQTSVSLDDAQ